MGLARGTADYLLLIDADMTIRQRRRCRGSAPRRTCCAESGALDFGVIRLVRGDRGWWYEGSTHEYIATDGQFSQERARRARDRASRRRRLTPGEAAPRRRAAQARSGGDPDNARAVFYLAPDLSRPRRAGAGDRVLPPASRHGRLGRGGLLRQPPGGRAARAETQARRRAVLLEAWERRPTRAEPLYELARLYRRRGDFALAHCSPAAGSRSPTRTTSSSSTAGCTTWGLLLERAIAAVGLGLAESAARRSARARRQPRAPARDRGVRAGARSTRPRPRSAGRRCPGGRRLRAPGRARAQPPDRRDQARRRSPPGRLSTRASRPTASGFRMIVRTANYADRARRTPRRRDPPQHQLPARARSRARRHRGRADRRPLAGARRHPSQIQGYEDCRLIELDGRWYATATVCELNPAERRESRCSRSTARTSSRSRAPGPPRRAPREELDAVRPGREPARCSTRCGPTVVLRCDPATARDRALADAEAPEIAD